MGTRRTPQPNPQSNQPAPPYLQGAWAVAFLLLAAGVPYLNSLHNVFHIDDYSQIVDSDKLQSLHSFLTVRPFGRSLTFATFFLNYQLHGLWYLPGWHAVNILLHAACVLSLYWLLRLMVAPLGGFSRAVPFYAALILAVHPLATEPVNYIQARSVLLYTLFSLLATCGTILLMGARPRRTRVLGGVLLGVCIPLAAMSKEVGLFYVLALPGAYWLLFVLPKASNKRRLAIWTGAAVVAVLVAGSLWLISTGAWAGIAERFNGRFADYFWSQTIIFWRYAGLAIWPLPSRLSVDQDADFGQHSFTDETVLVASLAILAIVVLPMLSVRRKRPAISWLLAAILIGLAPYFVMTSFEMMVEYRCYLPMVAFSALAAIALTKIGSRRGWLTPAVAVLLCGAMAAGVFVRNQDWRTRISLRTDAMNKAPRKARAVNGLAWVLLKDENHPDPKQALELAKRSLNPLLVDRCPYNPGMWDTLAEAYFANGDPSTAAKIEQAILDRGVGGADLEFFRKQLARYRQAQYSTSEATTTPASAPAK